MKHGVNFVYVSDRAALQAIVDRGLRARYDATPAQLEISGLAARRGSSFSLLLLLFVELDFMDPHKYPGLNVTTDVKYVVIPSAPSEIPEFRASAAALVANATTLLHGCRRSTSRASPRS